MKTRSNAFTLIELLAVVLVIALLAALTIGVARFVSEKAKANRARAEIAALEAAIESYKSDYGYYPITSEIRLSYLPYPVQSNSWHLYRALSQQAKKYITFRSGQLEYDGFNRVTYITDPWKNPLVYYNPITNLNFTSVSDSYILTPGTTYELTGQNYYTKGGKINAMTFDLFSYGPDKITYLPAAPVAGWSNANAALDDIWCGK